MKLQGHRMTMVMGSIQHGQIFELAWMGVTFKFQFVISHQGVEVTRVQGGYGG